MPRSQSWVSMEEQEVYSPGPNDGEKSNQTSTHTSFMISDILDPAPIKHRCSLSEDSSVEEHLRESPRSAGSECKENRESSPSSDGEDAEKSTIAQGLLVCYAVSRSSWSCVLAIPL